MTPVLISRYYLVMDTCREKNAVLDGFYKVIPVSISLGNAK
jgi:hypothetical protein